MITNRNAQAALDITRGIIHDQEINPTWTPTDSQIDCRIRDYCAEEDPKNPLDRDRIRKVVRFAIFDL